MNLSTLETSQEQAQIAYRQYRQLAKRSSEDEAIMRAYRQAAKGTPLINVPEVIRGAGVNDQGLPHLAIAKAHERSVLLKLRSDVLQFGQRDARSYWMMRESDEVRISWTGQKWPMNEATAMVPIIPPHLRPAEALHNYHILWEAEWRKVVPKDPALLKHVGGDIYAVLAVWDLTEIERAVLSARFS